MHKVVDLMLKICTGQSLKLFPFYALRIGLFTSFLWSSVLSIGDNELNELMIIYKESFNLYLIKRTRFQITQIAPCLFKVFLLRKKISIQTYRLFIFVFTYDSTKV